MGKVQTTGNTQRKPFPSRQRSQKETPVPKLKCSLTYPSRTRKFLQLPVPTKPELQAKAKDGLHNQGINYINQETNSPGRTNHLNLPYYIRRGLVITHSKRHMLMKRPSNRKKLKLMRVVI